MKKGMQLALPPWQVSDRVEGRIDDANCQPIAWLSIRLATGDYSWRDIANMIAAAPEMEAALVELAPFTFDLLTGPIMRRAGIIWPKGGPQSPVLERARAALRKARGEAL